MQQLPEKENAKRDTVTVGDPSESLCGIAAAAGFADCKAIRDHAPNNDKPFLKRPLQAGDEVAIPEMDPASFKKEDNKVHRFVLPQKGATLRFVHGGEAKAPQDDPALTCLCISNMRPDKGGDNRKGEFPKDTVTGYDKTGDGDPDSFKVEVVDADVKGNEVTVALEALKPAYNAQGRVEGHVQFAKAERQARSLSVKCARVEGTSHFLSAYLKLVVDQQDKDVRPTQTLLTAVLEGDDSVEILDQEVRAEYTLAGCPGEGDSKCRITRNIPVGSDRKRVNIALHVVQTSRTGPGVIALDVVRRNAIRYVRELYAQCNMSIKLVDEPRLIPPPGNLIAIANESGDPAEGGKAIKVAVTVDGVRFEAGISTAKGDPPIATALKLKKAIEDASKDLTFKTPFVVRAEKNPMGLGYDGASADVIIGDPMEQDVLIEMLSNEDALHPAEVASFDPELDTVPCPIELDAVGSPLDRVLIKNYKSGADRIDVFVVRSSQRVNGLSWIKSPLLEQKEPSIDSMASSAIVVSAALADGSSTYTTIAHECGHVLMDTGHMKEETEMMRLAGKTDGDDRNALTGPKRISDPRSQRNEFGVEDLVETVNPTSALRTLRPDLLTDW